MRGLGDNGEGVKNFSIDSSFLTLIPFEGFFEKIFDPNEDDGPHTVSIF